jgi:alpha-glucosidase
MNYAGFTNPVWAWLGEPSPNLFFGTPATLPAHDGPAVATAMDTVAAMVSWRTRLANYNLLGSHDTPRFRSVVGGRRDRHLAGLALLATMPGTPMVFQGDELGMAGDHTHLSRAPLPWDDPAAVDAETLAAYRSLLGLRDQLPVLRHGSFRWVDVGTDHLAFLRERDGERILVAVSRRGAPVPCDLRGDRLAGALELAPTGGSGEPGRTAAQGANGDATGGANGDGAAYGVWALP